MPLSERQRQLTAIVLLAFGIAVVVIAIRQGSSYSGPSEKPIFAPMRAPAILGFDRNDYPGDAALPALRRTFAFSSYWLNAPPGATSNSWTGKRNILAENGFGFLVLFNGRASAELKSEAAAAKLGAADASDAAASAAREGFAKDTVIFLDQEEGGRMLPGQLAYIFAWMDGVRAAGFRAGIYCSAMPVNDGGAMITTAEDVRVHARGRPIVFWVYNDACPPAPGCVYPENPPEPAASGFKQAEVWQFSQSPRRKEFTQRCAATYAPDGYCYSPGPSGQSGQGAQGGQPGQSKMYLDLDSANSADPSHGGG